MLLSTVNWKIENTIRIKEPQKKKLMILEQYNVIENYCPERMGPLFFISIFRKQVFLPKTNPANFSHSALSRHMCAFLFRLKGSSSAFWQGTCLFIFITSFRALVLWYFSKIYVSFFLFQKLRCILARLFFLAYVVAKHRYLWCWKKVIIVQL